MPLSRAGYNAQTRTKHRHQRWQDTKNNVELARGGVRERDARVTMATARRRAARSMPAAARAATCLPADRAWRRCERYTDTHFADSTSEYGHMFARETARRIGHVPAAGGPAVCWRCRRAVAAAPTSVAAARYTFESKSNFGIKIRCSNVACSDRPRLAVDDWSRQRPSRWRCHASRRCSACNWRWY